MQRSWPLSGVPLEQHKSDENKEVCVFVFSPASGDVITCGVFSVPHHFRTRTVQKCISFYKYDMHPTQSRCSNHTIVETNFSGQRHVCVEFCLLCAHI